MLGEELWLLVRGILGFAKPKKVVKIYKKLVVNYKTALL